MKIEGRQKSPGSDRVTFGFHCALAACLFLSSTCSSAAKTAHRKTAPHSSRPTASRVAFNWFNRAKPDGSKQSAPEVKKVTPQSPDRQQSSVRTETVDRFPDNHNGIAPAVISPTVGPNARPTIVDTAFISILRDLVKALPESDQIKKLESPCQKEAFKLAITALHRALEQRTLPSDRILTPSAQAAAEKSMVVESWDSGNILLSPDCHASINALWAKRINGTVTISMAGDCSCASPTQATKVGEFVMWLAGKSTMDNGFDIQSQSRVNFWLGKLDSLNLDSSCAERPVARAASPQGAVVLKALPTRQHRQYLAERRQCSDDAYAISPKPSVSISPNRGDITSSGTPILEVNRTVLTRSDTTTGGPGHECATNYQAHTASGISQAEIPTPDLSPTTAPHQEGGVSQPLPTLRRRPSARAAVMAPSKATAGQFLTVTVISPSRKAEPLVELSFNDSHQATDQDGKAVFMVPEDSIPGPSLSVSLVSRPELAPIPINILQPLSKPSAPQTPRIDGVPVLAQAGSTVIIQGHNFDGVADHNRLIIDGLYEARILAASPVELKADLPGGLTPGAHTITIVNAGLRSNTGRLNIVAINIGQGPRQRGKDAISRLIVRVVGTRNPVKVRLTNYTPAVIRMVKGNDLRVTTTGGPNNSTMIAIERLCKGSYHIQAQVQ